VSTICPATADVLLLYPGESLRSQIRLWAMRHPERRVDASREKSLVEIRRLLCQTAAAVVDATEDPGQATDAFLQAVARLGAAAVTMYSEATHDDLELFVRLRGSLFLLGPVFDEQWEGVFQHLLRAGLRRAAPPSAPQRLEAMRAYRRIHRRRQRYVNRLREGLD
jgi:hypothetical protein